MAVWPSDSVNMMSWDGQFRIAFVGPFFYRWILFHPTLSHGDFLARLALNDIIPQKCCWFAFLPWHPGGLPSGREGALDGRH